MANRRIKLRERRSQGRGLIVVFATLAIAAAVLGAATFVSVTRPEGTVTGLGYTPPEPKKFNYLRVSVIGDSLAAGAGATTKNLGYASLLASQLCWRNDIHATPTTGYLNPGSNKMPEPYTDVTRLGRVASDEPELVLIQSSLSDPAVPQLYDAVSQVLTSIARLAPEARVLVIGPTSPPSLSVEAAIAIRNPVQRAAEDAGVAFVDPIALGTFTPSDYSVDSTHLNNSGHLKMAEMLRDELAALEITRTDTCRATNANQPSG